MNIYVKVIALIFVVFYFLIAFVAWDLAWVADAPVGGRFAFLVFGSIFSAGGCISVEEGK
jgi:hypothetical protein